jgi:hypothetical protein
MVIRRLSEEEIAAAAAALLPDPIPLPPMPLWEIIDHVATVTNRLMSDVLTVCESIDADLTDGPGYVGPRDRTDAHADALRLAGRLAELYGDALDTVRTLAASIDHALPEERNPKRPTAAQMADPRYLKPYRR